MSAKLTYIDFVVFVLSLVLVPVSNAAFWNIDFQGDPNHNNTYGQTDPVDYIEPGVYWNVFEVAALSAPWPGPTNYTTNPSMNLVDSEGCASPVTFSIFGDAYGWAGGDTDDPLTGDYLIILNNFGVINDPLTWEITGLAPNTDYCLTYYHYGKSVGRGINFAADGVETSISVAGPTVASASVTTDNFGMITGTADSDGFSEGDWSALTISTDATIATSPHPANGAMDVSTDVDLGWSRPLEPGGPPRYDVYIDTDQTAVDNADTSTTDIYKGRMDINTYSYDPGPLNECTTYFCRIDSVHPFWDSSPGEIEWNPEKYLLWSFTTGPGKASNLSVPDGAVNVPIDEVLSWDSSLCADGYEVYIGTDENAVANADRFSPEYQDFVYTNSWQFTDLEPGVTYYYRIDTFGPLKKYIGDILDFTTALIAEARELIEETPKVQLTVDPYSLGLKWNGDQGQAGRGDGEVYVQTWIHWPAKVEDANDPQHRELGPLGGKDEFLTGTIADSNDPRYLIEPAIVMDRKFARLYKNTVDCPIPNYFYIDVLVWDDDSNAGLMAIVNIIKNLVKTAVAKMPGVPIATEVISKLIDHLTKGGKTMIGRAKKVKVEIGSQEEIDALCECQRKAIVTAKKIKLKNIVKLELWTEMEFKKDGEYITIADEDTFPRATDIIEALDIIGYLDLSTWLEKLNEPSSHEVNEGAASSKEIKSIDIGQHDESIISAALGLGGTLPVCPISREYSMFLDIDNDLATGAQGYPYDGAEFKLVAEFDNLESPTYRLMQYNSDTGVFEEVPAGVYDGALNIDRAAIYLQVELSTIGDPVGPIAAWGVVREQGEAVDVLPENPEQLALGLTPNYIPTGIPPMVVRTDPPHDAVDVDRTTLIEVWFSKSMTRSEAEAAFSMDPPVAGSFAWRGNKLFFTPSGLLEPMTRYEVTIGAGATDRAGTLFDGNGDLTPGDSFTWEFITAGLPLFASGVDGVEQGVFYEGEPIYVTGTNFAPLSEVEIYIVRHARAELIAGAELVDVTDTGSTLASINVEGVLPPTLAGSISDEGEYNFIVDLNSNGLFDPSIDRCDKTGIGFAVFPRSLPGDINKDGCFDFLDLAELAKDWMKCTDTLQ